MEEGGTIVDTKVKEKHNMTLTCEASGNLSHVIPQRRLMYAALEIHFANLPRQPCA